MDRMPGWIDRDRRLDASIVGFIMLPDGQKLSVTVADISNDGCQIRFAAERTVPIGANVVLDLELARLQATVRRSLDGRAGLQFATPLS